MKRNEAGGRREWQHLVVGTHNSSGGNKFFRWESDGRSWVASLAVRYDWREVTRAVRSYIVVRGGVERLGRVEQGWQSTSLLLSSSLQIQRGEGWMEKGGKSSGGAVTGEKVVDVHGGHHSNTTGVKATGAPFFKAAKWLASEKSSPVSEKRGFEYV
ncbi:unnamed protein product [Lactuca virosa]|uniref:Uncharacterized protein n=1 Tax=Lactuca virosa TaxID=75947 RepID=A0AAU9PF53_9ASTR|nr:unnamed protein product [Lactuca virosa]